MARASTKAKAATGAATGAAAAGVTPAALEAAKAANAATEAARMAAATEPSPKLDEQPKGGRYLRADGKTWQNGKGQELDPKTFKPIKVAKIEPDEDEE